MARTDPPKNDPAPVRPFRNSLSRSSSLIISLGGFFAFGVTQKQARLRRH